VSIRWTLLLQRQQIALEVPNDLATTVGGETTKDVDGIGTMAIYDGGGTAVAVASRGRTDLHLQSLLAVDILLKLPFPVNCST
jgi:hypothetical protein